MPGKFKCSSDCKRERARLAGPIRRIYTESVASRLMLPRLVFNEVP